MADNKFIKHLRGEDTAKSVLEIKNQRTTTSFANMPDGDTSNANDVYSDYRGNATGVLKGTENWKLDGQNLVETTTVYGDGRDFTDSFSVFGNGLWVDASFAFATARRFSPNTKFVLKLCGHDLETVINHTVDFTLIVKFGASNLISKTFTVTEQAFDFCKEFVIDFAESNSETIKVDAGSTMQVQLLCADPAAQAVLYNGMTVFTALQRRVDADVVASDKKTFDEVVQDIIEVGEEIDRITDSLSDHVADKNNPHQVTKAQVGLGNVDNTSDLNKPISTATQNALDDITDLIPAQATPQNQLGDKNFINSSIATNTANFIGTFNSVAELNAYSGTKTNNDYAFVVATDSAGNTVYNRYKYTTATTPASWVFEYALNNSSFTAQQWASINSGVTTSDVSKARSAVQPSDLGNGTITITQGGVTKGLFALNQATDDTIELDAGGGGSSYHPDLFDVKWADHICNDVQWLRADTFSWQSGAVYETAYQHLVDDIDGFSSSIDILIPAQGESLTFVRYEDGDITGYYAWKNNDSIAYTDTLSLSVGDDAYLSLSPVKTGEITSVNNSLQSETIDGTTVQFYLADDGHKICPASEESNVVAIYNTTGVAWYYIIDTVNERFKLPRTQYGVTGLRDTVGNYVAPGLPNITGKFAYDVWQSASYDSGAFYNDGGNKRCGTDNDSNSSGGRTAFDASRSSAIYGASTTVQPPATQMYLYFYVGNFTQTALENTAGLNAELFNDKVDVGHEVIEFQAPTAENNYTWYRKYADGWVEQGGIKAVANTSYLDVTLPITMTDANYIINTTSLSTVTDGIRAGHVLTSSKTATGFRFGYINGGTAITTNFTWEVKGMYAQ